MAVLTVQRVIRAGIIPSYGAAAGGGDSFPNDGNTILHVKNGGAGSINVTLAITVAADGEDIADRVVAVGIGAEKLIGPFPTHIFNNAAGEVPVAYSGVTTVTVAAIGI